MEAAQDGAYIQMTLTEYQSFLLRLTAIEDNTKIREERILNLEARLDEAQVEIQAVKKQLREVNKTVNNTEYSLEFTQDGMMTLWNASRTAKTSSQLVGMS